MKPTRSYKILLMGDASNFHRCLAEGLRRMGHEVTVASDGTAWMQTERDIDISRRGRNKLWGLELWLRMKRMADRELAGYDIVSVIGVCFVHLKPCRIKWIFDRLVANNGHVFVTSLGGDTEYIRESIDGSLGLRYTEWRVGDHPSPMLEADPEAGRRWLTPELVSLNNHIESVTEGTVTALYEYNVACSRYLPPEKLAYGGIPIDTASVRFSPLPENIKKVRFFLGRHRGRLKEKGTDRLEAAARRVVEKYPDKAELIVVENVPYAEYLKLLGEAHVVLDQLYSYTPATNALLAMAMGKVAVSGGEPEFYDFIGESELRPIINGLPDDDILFNQLEWLVLYPDTLSDLGRQGRLFVEKHNDVMVVAKRFLDFWESRINS